MIEINSKIYTIMAFIGMLTCCVFFIFFISCIISTIYWNFKLYKLKHKQKHRFSKAPTAACYCRDCDRWDSNKRECSGLNSRKTKDDWFCKDAVRNVSLPEEERRNLRDRLKKCIENKKK